MDLSSKEKADMFIEFAGQMIIKAEANYNKEKKEKYLYLAQDSIEKAIVSLRC